MDGSWRKVAANELLKRAETQLLQTYLERRQATVEEWAAIRDFFDVCVRETGYEVGGNIKVTWCRQAAAEKQMKVTVGYILVAERVWRRQESGRCG